MIVTKEEFLEQYGKLSAEELYESIFPLVEPCFVAWSNTDLTEGRGSQIPIAVSKSYSCAERLGRKKGVQGSDASVKKDWLIRLGGQYYGRINLNYATVEDTTNDTKYQQYKEAVARAQALGLTGDDLKILSGGN